MRRRLGEAEVEGERLLELRLDQPLVVGEHESRTRGSLAELRREGDRPRVDVGVVGRLAVGDVERVRRLPRVEARDRGVGIGASGGDVERIVGVERPDLPTLRIQKPFTERVQVRLEARLDAVDQPLHRLGLRLGGRAGTAVGLVRRIRRRSLVVVAPVLLEVAVRIDAVADRDLPVAVVVAQVLAPQPLVVERVLVAVGVRGDHEPQLRRLEQVLDLLVVRPPAVDVVVQQAPVDLEADPLARMLVRRIEDRRARSVLLAARALRELQGDQLATLLCRPEDLELDELRVVLSHVVELVADAPRFVPGPVYVVATGRLGGGLLGDRLALAVTGQLDLDAGGSELRALAPRQDGLCSESRLRLSHAGELGAPCGLGDLVGRPLSVYISRPSSSTPWPEAAGAIAKATATAVSTTTTLSLDHIKLRPS